MDDRRRLSLVIPSNRGGPALMETIAAFAREDDALDIIVVESARDGSRETIQVLFPGVTVLHFDDVRTLPQLRAAGLLAARGELVALTSDACSPAPGWAGAVRRAHQQPAAAIGGAVENASTTRLVDWAVFFCEYGRYMLPFAPARTSDLPGQNVSYKREALTEIREVLLSGVWEPFWHWELAARGADLRRDPSVVVTLRRHDTVSGFVRERFHYARSFAGQRLRDARWPRRAAYAIGTVLLPLLLLARIASQLLPKRRALGRLACSVPYLVVFTCAWAAGECVGYLAGAGTSAARVG